MAPINTKMDQSNNRGVKRKRYEPPEEEMSVKVGGKLHHELKEVHKASKKAKVFETQKVVKRLKDLRKKDENDKSIVDFEAELTTLKDIDHDTIGTSALRSKILKDHTLRESEDVKTATKKELETHLLIPAEPGTTLAKIQSRLLSSKILATQVTASMNSLKYLLDPALKQRDNATDVKADASGLEQSPKRPCKILKKADSHDKTQITIPKSDDTHTPLTLVGAEEAGSDSDFNSSRNEGGWESGSIDEEGKFNDDGWESGSIGSAASADEDEDEGSEDESDDENDELKVVKPTTKTKAQKPVSSAKPVKSTSSKMESTFLPSLSVGFVRGEEDSDFSDVDDKAAEMPKKNRRGQRARRLIWEKKFGRNANHKKKEAEAIAAVPPNPTKRGHTRPTTTSANALPSHNMPTQGPPASGKGNSWGKNIPRQHQPVDIGWAGRTKDTSAASRVFKPPATAKSDNQDKLHPSWEAKRKLKEKEIVGIVPSTGKKIKFS